MAAGLLRLGIVMPASGDVPGRRIRNCELVHFRLPSLPPQAEVRAAVADSVLLAIACLVSYWVTTKGLSLVYSVSKADDALGGMWSVIATVFLFRDSYNKSLAAAVSRMTATLVSFVLCLAYLAVLPFNPWGLAILVGLSVLVTALIGRPEDEITAGITTTVVIVVASLSPHEAWRQPILRLADTAVGVAVGLAAAWLGLRAVRPLFRQSRSPLCISLTAAATSMQAWRNALSGRHVDMQRTLGHTRAWPSWDDRQVLSWC